MSWEREMSQATCTWPKCETENALLRLKVEFLKQRLIESRAAEQQANDAYVALREIFKLKDKMQ